MAKLHSSLTDENDLHVPKGFTEAATGTALVKDDLGVLEWRDLALIGATGPAGPSGPQGADGLISEVQENGTPITDAGQLNFAGGLLATSDGTTITVRVDPTDATAETTIGSGDFILLHDAGNNDLRKIDWDDVIVALEPALDHGNLAGLGDDDHTQYALLGGRATGQILTGGINANDALELRSTTNASKGDVIIGADGSGLKVGDFSNREMLTIFGNATDSPIGGSPRLLILVDNAPDPAGVACEMVSGTGSIGGGSANALTFNIIGNPEINSYATGGKLNIISRSAAGAQNGRVQVGSNIILQHGGVNGIFATESAANNMNIGSTTNLSKGEVRIFDGSAFRLGDGAGVGTYIIFDEIAEPAAPAANSAALYMDSVDEDLKWKRSNGDIISITGAEPHGELAAIGNAVAQNPATTYIKVNQFNTAGLSQDVTVSAANDDMTISIAGIYRVQVAMSMIGANNVTYTFAIFVDAVEQTKVRISRKTTSATDVGAIALTGLLNLPNGTEVIDIRVLSDSGGGANLLIEDANFNIERIG